MRGYVPHRRCCHSCAALFVHRWDDGFPEAAQWPREPCPKCSSHTGKLLRREKPAVRAERAILLKTLDRSDLRPHGGGHRSNTGTRRFVVQQDSTSAALTFATAILGPSQAKSITQDVRRFSSADELTC